MHNKIHLCALNSDYMMHIRIADLFLEVGALHLQPVKVQKTLTIRLNMGVVVAKMIQLMMMKIMMVVMMNATQAAMWMLSSLF